MSTQASTRLDADDAIAAEELHAYSNKKLAGLFFTNAMLLAIARTSKTFEEETNVFARTHRLVIAEGKRRGRSLEAR